MEKRRRSDLVNQSKVRANLRGNRKMHNISLLNETWRLVGKIVETGAGKYGSAFIDHAVRFFIAALSGDTANIEIIVKEIEPFVVSTNFSNNIRKIADRWDAREENIEL
jgi:formiminotetrahydrofolate cyclodeaminase